jgi:hypothetical protein
LALKAAAANAASARQPEPLRGNGYRILNTNVKPNSLPPNHCDDFNAKPLALGDKSPHA